ncbi:energy transducer TonB [Ramlibacter paludis]|uniref:energy transducer TonB n=1 Tax=Ramlibacter paludis TaxID=2908000 RepID=UPI0023DC27AF|nr:energy transducer TonB [Ramlibacter paludis]
MTDHISHRRSYGGGNPRRRAIGWLAVIVLHAIILWALVTGTARKGLELIKKPLEAVVIQEVIIPPPPPPPPPPPKKIEKVEPRVEKAPPPPFVPPPEVTPPAQTNAPVIQSVQTPPPAPPVIAPPPPPAPPAPVGPKRIDVAIACSNINPPEMPRAATRDKIEGLVKAQITLKDGAITDVTILSGPRVFHSVVRETIMQYKCQSQGDGIAIQEFNFKF